ncbi:nucleotidyl transferase AbiEii/AbiGii toxin family protein [[Pseudomonas] carboxydohydrogena]|uniref:Nucleotidyl transferase AbiEii/AbiGii toxin family protein n=1 Tax=Afipia carboxydohydrogena TaxID=290 RepID=A0ABY8BNX9_AFICR|nr:nucleotidyl transferase AbiEii/AbiGii toxin family protein [[Pseudomonas] carboxydohydrogena]RTL75118.1 MAG: nucleotidyl transferase AbiEii/AbiGii toxin family protein [Bradyrhizobiaceae bacterium]WEF51684.1 nucleotidyl transferase AbiEii/AbiGii toxin family protein [[Pseudomonas] carboxydohydrogena]
MNGKPSLDDFVDVQDHFGLPSAGLVEKDWHVARALAAIAAVDTGDLRLVFGGGTALSRAYKLTNRMSEDIDLKIVSDNKPSSNTLRKFRQSITNALLGVGFVFDPANEAHRRVMYGGEYTKYMLPYEAVAQGAGLRPGVQIEFSVWPLRRPAIDKPIASFYAEAKGLDPEVASIPCSSVLETAAEKLTGLTWRAGSELAGLRKDRDPTLVRHIYDLHMTREAYDAKEVATLAREVMKDDAATRGKSFPAYRKDPLAETLRAIEGIPKDKVFIDGYATFQRDMVYGDKPDFATAMISLDALADHLKKL